jgi:hypothetical protein
MSRLPAWRFRAPFEDFAGKLTGTRAREEANDCSAMTAWDQKRKLKNVLPSSALPDIAASACELRKVPKVEMVWSSASLQFANQPH